MIVICTDLGPFQSLQVSHMYRYPEYAGRRLRPNPPAIQPEPAGPGQTSSCWFDPPAGPAHLPSAYTGTGGSSRPQSVQTIHAAQPARHPA